MIVPTDASVCVYVVGLYICTYFFRSLLRDNRETGRRLARLYKILNIYVVIALYNRIFYSLYFIFSLRGTYTAIIYDYDDNNVLTVCATACTAVQKVCMDISRHVPPYTRVGTSAVRYGKH